jgi:hypothetical protein
VRIVGELDMNFIPQTRNEDATAKLAQLDAEWLTIRAGIVAKAISDDERDQQLRVAVRRYRNARAAMQEAPTLTVVVGHVELLDGTPATDADVTELIQQSRQRPARHTQSTPPVLPTRGTNAIEEQSTAGIVGNAVQDGTGVQDAVVEEAHPAAVTTMDMPGDTEVVEQPVAEGRPRRRREPVPANGIAEVVEG